MGFVVRAGSSEFRGKRLILATGVVDELPSIPGLSERWGERVFFCPYCDGYEVGLGNLGVLATSHRCNRRLNARYLWRCAVPVAPLTSQLYVLVTGKSSGINTVSKLIAAGKAESGKLKFDSTE